MPRIGTAGWWVFAFGALRTTWDVIAHISTAKFVYDMSGWLSALWASPYFSVVTVAVGVLLILADRRWPSLGKATNQQVPFDGTGYTDPDAAIDEQWIGMELRWLGYPADEVNKHVRRCVQNLRKNGISSRKEARAFFDDTDTRRQYNRLYDEVFQRPIDPDGYANWAVEYYRAPAGPEKHQIFVAHRARFEQMRDDGAR